MTDPSSVDSENQSATDLRVRVNKRFLELVVAEGSISEDVATALRAALVFGNLDRTKIIDILHGQNKNG
jgi:hypothetical protein